jgi:Quinohemoprotein amine dehydrogenase, alpha subunit domain III
MAALGVSVVVPYVARSVAEMRYQQPKHTPGHLRVMAIRQTQSSSLATADVTGSPTSLVPVLPRPYSLQPRSLQISGSSPTAQGAAAVTLSGMLLDSEGNPIAGTSNGPVIQLSDSGGGTYTTTVAADGSFSVLADAGSYSLNVLGSWSPTAASTVRLSLQTTIDLTANTVQNLTLNTAFVNTTVTDSSGNPVAGAIVEMAPNAFECADPTSFELFPGAAVSGYYRDAVATTDASGLAALPVLPCQDPLSLEVFPPAGSGLAGTTVNGVSVSGDTSLSITLPAAVTLSGMLLDSEGNPIAGTSNGPVIQLSDSGGGTYTTTVAADGSFSVLADAGSYSLNVLGSWSPTAASTVRLSLQTTIDLTANTVQNLTLNTAFVNTTVTDSSGNPVAGAIVEMAPNAFECADPTSFELFPGAAVSGYYRDAVATTDASGLAALPVLPCQDPLSLEVFPPAGSGLAGTTVNGVSVSGDTSLSITLYSIYGELTNNSGSPLAGQTVELSEASPVRGSAVAQRSQMHGAAATSTRTDAAGIYGLTVPPAIYTMGLSGTSVTDSLPSSYTLSVPGIDLTNGRIQNLTLPVTPLTVTVKGPTGAAVSHAQVSVPCTATAFSLFAGGGATGTVCGAGVTNRVGIAKIALLPAASFSLTVVPPGGSGLLPTSLSNLSTASGTTFAVTLSQEPQVVVATVSPAQLGQGATKRLVTVFGSGFSAPATLTISGLKVTGLVVVSSTQITAMVSVPAAATAGAETVKVTSAGSRAGVCIGCFVVDPAPSVSLVAPSALTQGATNQAIEVVGEGFEAPVAITIPGARVTAVVVISPTQITAEVSVKTHTSTGSRNVSVINGDSGVGLCLGCVTITPPTVVEDVSSGTEGDSTGSADMRATLCGGPVDGSDAMEQRLSRVLRGLT